MGAMQKASSMQWPANLLHAVNARCGGISVDSESWPADMEASVEYAISLLGDRNRKIIVERFKMGYTLEIMSKARNISREAIRQAIEKALRIMCRPEIARYLRYGVSGAVCKAAADAAETARKRVHIENIKFLEAIRAADDLEAAKTINLLDMSVADLGLSRRSKNGLLRAGVKTVGAVLELDANSLARIRNIGVVSHDEIVRALKGIGVCCDHIERKKKKVSYNEAF